MKPNLIENLLQCLLYVNASRAREGGVGREEKKQKEGRKGKEGVPSYGASVQGHTKRREEKGSQL